jgi:hypothetical protein
MDLAPQGGVSPASAAYRRRQPEREALHELVRDHFETFRARAASLRDGQGLPRFVEEAASARSATASPTKPRRSREQAPPGSEVSGTSDRARHLPAGLRLPQGKATSMSAAVLALSRLPFV